VTTITERMKYASAAAHDFAKSATDQIFDPANIRNTVSDAAVFKEHSALIVAMIDAAARVYAVERQCEVMREVGEALQSVATAIQENNGVSL
jgi:hypothetical protein